MKIKPFLGASCLVFAYGLMSACSSQNTVSPVRSAKTFHDRAATITIKNHGDAQRDSAPIYISFKNLGLKVDDVANLYILSGHKTLAYETIDRDGDGSKDGIFVLTDIGSKQTQIWNLKKGGDLPPPTKPKKLTQAEISVKQDGKWVPHPDAKGKKAYQGDTFKNVGRVTLPEYYTDHSNWIRYEGPGIESDKVAYRIYLDHRNGFDIFGKTVSDPVLQKIGQDGYESYHQMQDWGMDILKVGASLGAGGFGFWNGQNVISLSDTLSRQARIIENGDLYSAFAIDYGQWLVDGERGDLSASFSMHGGSRLVHTRITMDKALPNFAIGVVKHAGTEFLQGKMNGENTYSYIGSWGRQSENGDHLGMAVIFKTQQFLNTFDDTISYVALMQPEASAASTVLEYYFVAAWQGEHGNGIDSKQDFIKYLDDEVQKLSQPLDITVSHRATD